ncbi:cysteine hydrolase family protein [Gloeocapsopsis dulcis]|uniref:Cysteine hydrolase n=1 Tax=Gloeocapsopsis dulcis AAB1 = 1H9 TaxID=1433147 RepID=A0A6N8FX30_9CHRO|nr:isochorismatase family cysteine hydrolase [Gloeocapsopsis dulcis]MUL36707.1 cysteine hydrolase [Gloeocapsopsis dulcis AAB1 = 1H9]WNN91280.1 cysteine hydrolase [Gloeocapsopsis dulcis]
MNLIPAQPYDYELPSDLQKVALLIIDMQRDFLEPGGFGEALGNDVSYLSAIIPTTKRLLKIFRELQLPIFYTIEGHQPNLSDCPPSKLHRGNSTLKIGDAGPMGRILVLGEPGNAIIPELQPIANETVISKPGKGAFYQTQLESHLNKQGITHLIITGVTTEVCVQTTMREANDRGFECLLVEDATASYFPQFRQSTLEMIRAQGGIVGWTATTANVIQALDGIE